MIYPKFLENNSTIGIAPMSAGVGHKIESFDKSLSRLKSETYKIKEEGKVRINDLRAGSGKERADALHKLFQDDDVDMIICASGGDFCIETLPHIDLDIIKDNPKWFLGASDPTSICFMVTTKLDIATLYGYNAGSYSTVIKHMLHL